ncbi:hypothetical protein B4U80_05605, partial [Leptotrombidium deliense]
IPLITKKPATIIVNPGRLTSLGKLWIAIYFKNNYKGIHFDSYEKTFLKEYIKNTKLRTQASSDFGKYFFKLMNNAIYGKTLEKVRNRQNIKIITNFKSAEKEFKKVTFKYRTIFNKNLIAVHLLNNYVGLSVLQLSKNLMYEIHYNVMKVKYPDIKLCYQDTDSFFYLVKTKYLYDDIKALSSHLDTSDYPKDHKLYSTLNNKVIEKLKMT